VKSENSGITLPHMDMAHNYIYLDAYCSLLFNGLWLDLVFRWCTYM